MFKAAIEVLHTIYASEDVDEKMYVNLANAVTELFVQVGSQPPP